MKKNLIILFLCAYFFSCKEDPAAVEPTPIDKTGILLFHLHTYIDLEEVDLYGIDYHTENGRTISLDMAQLYIYDVQLEKQDGSFYDIAGKKLLKILEKDSYVVGNVPVGAYKSIRFKVGLDAATNSLAPAASPDSSILDRPEMWMGTMPLTDGYALINVQGKIDTSADMTALPVPFAYKIASKMNNIQVTMPEKNIKVEEGNALYSHIIIDYSKLFRGIALNEPGNLKVVTMAENTLSVADKIVQNIPSMFIYE